MADFRQIVDFSEPMNNDSNAGIYNKIPTKTVIFSKASHFLETENIAHADIDEGRIIAYRNCGLSYHNIAARVGRDPKTVSKIGNRWAQDGNTERRAGSQRPCITSSREDRHVTAAWP
ncbi:HTH_Tnp_Tc3_2 domain-containing protein [Trichonephila clavipes]|nr:HTH_Tnp_Tc3_2 domain-containing protein [Trichonephila clavipes]